ncbi:MAG: prepilin-type N-terminal cleavage/methylation domain-containing protein [Polyangiales bacterium]
MLLSTVYPTVKPLLEGAIRRLTVTVRWNEGSQEHSFSVVEYVINPGQTLPAAELLQAAEQAAGAAAGIPAPPAPPARPSTPSSVAGGHVHPRHPGGAPMSPARSRLQRGVTLLEVMVAMTVLVMAATMIWAAFDQTGRIRSTPRRARRPTTFARVAMQRITRPARRVPLAAREPAADARVDPHGLHRREPWFPSTSRASRTDAPPGHLLQATPARSATASRPTAARGVAGGGLRPPAARVAASTLTPSAAARSTCFIPGIRQFELRFWDDAQERWIESWDTQQATAVGCPARAPTLTLREGERGPSGRPQRDRAPHDPPLTFGLPIY